MFSPQKLNSMKWSRFYGVAGEVVAEGHAPHGRNVGRRRARVQHFDRRSCLTVSVREFNPIPTSRGRLRLRIRTSCSMYQSGGAQLPPPQMSHSTLAHGRAIPQTVVDQHAGRQPAGLAGVVRRRHHRVPADCHCGSRCCGRARAARLLTWPRRPDSEGGIGCCATARELTDRPIPPSATRTNVNAVFTRPSSLSNHPASLARCATAADDCKNTQQKNRQAMPRRIGITGKFEELFANHSIGKRSQYIPHCPSFSYSRCPCCRPVGHWHDNVARGRLPADSRNQYERRLSMLKPIRLLLPALLAASLAACASFAAEGAGQADLDKASEAKLTANTVADLNEVIQLLESALKKGLDATNTEFANRLLTSTLIQRAKRRPASRHVLDGRLSRPPQGGRLRSGESPETRPEAGAGVSLARPVEHASGRTRRQGRGRDARQGDRTGRRGYRPQRPRRWCCGRTAGAAGEETRRFRRGRAFAARRRRHVRDRGLALADMDKPERALADLNKAIELEPNNGPTYEAKAIVLARLKKFDEALAALDKAANSIPTRRARSCSGRGFTHSNGSSMPRSTT